MERPPGDLTHREIKKWLRDWRNEMHAPKRKPRPTNEVFQVPFSAKANAPYRRTMPPKRMTPVKCLNSQHGGEVFYESLEAAGKGEGIAASTMSNIFAKARKAGESVATAKGRRFEYV